MKVLIYNWVPFDIADQGGGVSVHLRQTIPHLIRQQGWDVSFLSAGRTYDALNRRCRWRATDNNMSELGVRTYEIVNSPIKAPAHESVAIISECLDNRTIAEVFIQMVEQTGPYDAIIVHNIEGISTVTFELLKTQVDTALILFMHNYHLVCPQIELLRDFERHCDDYHDGKDCIGCFGFIHDTRRRKALQAVDHLLSQARLAKTPVEDIARATIEHGVGWSRRVLKAARSVKRPWGQPIQAPDEAPPARWRASMLALDDSIDGLTNWSGAFRRWRELNVQRANHLADGMITVSGRAKAQLTQRGLDPARIDVLHLGFGNFVDPERRLALYDAKKRPDRPLRLGFFGYAIPSKGLRFLLEALEDAGPWARRLELCIYARYDDGLHRRLARLDEKLAAVRWIDGYRQDELPDILDFVDLAIVPSIWWETYSITAYELAMAGVPTLMSDSVGFAELVGDERFQFRRGDKTSLLNTLAFFVGNPAALRDYFKDQANVPSLEQHLARLVDIVEKAVASRTSMVRSAVAPSGVQSP
jgi:glycosyltransferase involved in cell wall biosynthesis